MSSMLKRLLVIMACGILVTFFMMCTCFNLDG